MKKICLLFIFGLFFSLSVRALPVIDQYSSYINVLSDGGLLFQEDITITTDGKTIQHGIYRDFPTRYKTNSGQDSVVSLIVKNAELNHVPVAYHTENLSNGVRIYLGSKNRFLPPATYTFTLTLYSLGQIGFFQSYDELYWNVTGNGWSFPISKATAIVKLPDDAAQNIMGYIAYTGYLGSRERNYTSYLAKDKTVVFETSKPLLPHQGLTIVVSWKKGFIEQPSILQRILHNYNNVSVLLILLIGFIVSLIYYYQMLNKHVSRFLPRVIIPEYEPPPGFTPASLRYILNMNYDNKILAAAILNLAVKGYLKIHETKSFLKVKYTLEKLPNFSGSLTDEEQVLVDNLFASSDIVELKHQEFLEIVATKFQDVITKEFREKYFITNTKYILIGELIVFVTVAISGMIDTVFLPMLFCVLLCFFCFFLISKELSNLWFKIIKSSLLAIVCLGVFYGGIFNFSWPAFGSSLWIYFVLMLLIIVTNLVFSFSMKCTTKLGQDLIDHIKGFKLFLNATEKDRLNFRNPPDCTPEIFEKYLPYALALGVEQRWAEQFSGILISANYQPTWYTGTNFGTFNSVAFASSMSSSFNNAISSATTAPGSSSGISGGSSGGGGGGGGGGGW